MERVFGRYGEACLCHTLRLWAVPFDLEAGRVVLSVWTLPPAARALFQAQEGLRAAG
ncbi:MAG: hypothetical protein ACXIUZ_02565 [Lysobacteraceae bacterium]